MITPAEIAAEFDAEGQTVTLQRIATGVVPVTATCKAMVRGYKAAELLGGIVQGDTRIVIAAATLAALGWPVPPKKGDKALIGSRSATVQGVETMNVRDEPAKYIIQARG